MYMTTEYQYVGRLLLQPWYLRWFPGNPWTSGPCTGRAEEVGHN